jgi:hypothetical protein
MKMKSVKIFGKSVPVLALALIAVTAVVAATIIGTVNMPWEIVSPPPPPPQPTASMSPSTVTVPIGTIYYDETKTVAPADVADLTVENGALDITASLGGDYGGFNALSVTIQLVQDGTVKYTATIQPTIIVSNTLKFGPTGVGGWSDKTASAKGQVVTCFVRKISGEGDWAQLVKWVPGATMTIGSNTYTYPATPFGYTYDSSIPETGYLMQNDDDAGEWVQLVLVYPPTSVTISGVAPGTYDVYIGFSVTAGNVASSGEATLSISW